MLFGAGGGVINPVLYLFCEPPTLHFRSLESKVGPRIENWAHLYTVQYSTGGWRQWSVGGSQKRYRVNYALSRSDVTDLIPAVGVPSNSRLSCIYSIIGSPST